jgi:hypothetical protein
VADTVKTIRRAGGEVEFVELTCSVPELRRRLDYASRNKYGKLRSVELFDELYSGGVFDALCMSKPILTVDTSLDAPDARGSPDGGAWRGWISANLVRGRCLTGHGFDPYDGRVGHSRPAFCRDLVSAAAS